MSLVLEILETLWDTTLYYKGIRVNVFGVHRPLNYRTDSLSSTLSRMRKNSLVDKIDDKWVITESGKKYFKSEKSQLTYFNSPFKKNSPRNLILMFDIPETEKIKRRWLRYHLKKFNYIMIQKSVWVGPSPLSEDFLSYVKKIKLNTCIRTFKLAKSFNNKIN